MSFVALLFAGCGLRTGMTPEDLSESDSATPLGGMPSTASAAGGASSTVLSSGGAKPPASGGFSVATSRSSLSLPSGGTTPAAGARASGGTPASTRTGGAGMPAGGTPVFVSSSSGGSTSRASSSPPLSCTGVTCPALPKTCKKIVQDPTACCPVCTDTGCPACSPPNCLSGTHLETLPGECCPSCVADPPNACKKGQQTYEDLRKAFLDKYGSTKCQNSMECSLVLESNACITVCNVPLPTSWVRDYQNNLASSAKSNCASCPTQDPVSCERMVATCLNGKCVAVNPS